MRVEITKELLSTYRSKKDEIVELDWMLNNRWRSETMIGNDVIFDYSKGYPMPQSVVGFDQEKYDRAQERDLRKKKELEQECVELEAWVEEIPDSRTRRIFRMCFIEGRRQKDVAKAVNLDRSRISRKIDDYLKNAHKAQNAHV
jgi:DNA-directed RNA polymerase specialized sigma subunit